MKFHRIIAAALVAALGFASPARATEAISTQQYQSGQIVQTTDLSGDIEAVRNLSGILATLLLGSANALPVNNPLALTLSNVAMTFSVGGSGQYVIAQDVVTSNNARIIDSCPLSTITIPANNTGLPRTDLLSIQYTQIPTSGHTVAFSNGSNQTVYKATEGCAYVYNAGTTTAPTGYVGFAKVVVPAGATTASQATVTYLFQSVGALLSAQLGNVVNTINGLSGAVTATAGTGITITPSGNSLTFATTAPLNPVSSLNSLTGPLSITSPGGTITVTPSGSSIALAVNFPTTVGTINGFTGTITVTNGVGISVTNSSGTITVANTGVTQVTNTGGGLSLGAATGTVDIEPNIIYDGSGTAHPAWRLCAGNATTNSSSLITVTCGLTTIVTASATFYDSSFSNSVVVSVKNITGNVVTMGSRYTNTNTATGSGIGLYYMVVGY